MAVVVLGVGHVARNIAHSTTTLIRGSAFQLQKITTLLSAAAKSLDSSKKTIVLVDILVIVVADGADFKGNYNIY
jgi:hypothetical protein